MQRPKYALERAKKIIRQKRLLMALAPSIYFVDFSLEKKRKKKGAAISHSLI